MNAVQEIHHAVDVANEELINPSTYEASHSINEQLKAMGFTESQNVSDEEDHRESHQYALDYKVRYPQFKFITLKQLNKICMKYDLKHDSFDAFKGAIPEKNAKELIAAKILASDIDVDFAKFNGTYENPFVVKAKIGEDPSEAIRNGLSGIFESIKKEVEAKKFAEAFKTVNQNSYLSIAEINKKIPSALLIAADPILFKQPEKFVCPMPAVLVKGGLLILTAWGAEANDVNVTNERMN